MAEFILPQIRCKICNRLLLKGEVWRIEIKCPKCGYLQMVVRPDKRSPAREIMSGETGLM